MNFVLLAIGLLPAWGWWSVNEIYRHNDSGLTQRTLTESEIHELTERGLSNLPQEVVLSEGYDEEGNKVTVDLFTAKGRLIPWGNFMLDNVNLLGSIQIIPEEGRPRISVMGRDDTFCSDSGDMSFERKENAPEDSLRFEDYELSQCLVKQVSLKVANKPLVLDEAYYRNMPVELETYSKSYQVSALYETKQPVEIMTPNQKENRQISVYQFYTDRQNKVVAIETTVYEPAGEVKMTKIGKCEYPLNDTDILLTDLTSKTAKWHFRNGDTEISHACQTQVLPYHIEVGKVR